MRFSHSLSLLLLALFMHLPSQAQGQLLPYRDHTLPIEERVSDLLKRMTLQEKIAQMETVWEEGRKLANKNGLFNPNAALDIIPLGIGHIGRPSENKSPLTTVKYTNGIQQFLVEETRLGIPAIFHEEALHGHAAPESTSFPQSIAMASTWDPKLIYDMYSISAAEVRARGGNQALTPILDVARDARWGRIEETMGEDTYLVTELGVAAIEGFQGKGQTIPHNKVAATLKHLTGHGKPESGLNIAPSPMGERELREVFLPSFEAAIIKGNARSVMASYNEIDGVPSHANKKLLTDILRGEWKFTGTLVSDYFAVNELITRHGLAGSKVLAATMALQAGVDIEMPDRDAFPTLLAAVEHGDVSEDLINQAVRRVLREKFRLGLFENPYTPEEGVNAFINNPTHRQAALTSAEKAIVLLKNDGILPLSLGTLGSIAVIGPHANETLLGGYSDIPRQTVPILEGIRSLVGEAAEVTYAPGTIITMPVEEPEQESISAKTFSKQRWNQDSVVLPTQKDKKGMIEEAIELAKNSDVAIVVVGGNEATSREAWADGHLGDRTSLNMIGDQEELVRRVLATGTPTVVVLNNGRPLVLEDLNQKAPAIVEAWYLGQETGTAVANVLFGKVNPGGKLPVTFPRNVGQLPLVYNHKPSAKRGYLFGDTSPQYAFGHGLSYTTFEYSALSIDDSNAEAHGEVKLRFTIKNTGDRVGDEVAQIYVRDVFASTTRPVMELKAFKRVTLQPKESKVLEVTLPINMLAYYDLDMNYVVEPGKIDLMIGGGSDAIALRGSFSIAGETSTQISQGQKAFLSAVRIVK
jgi:beta-glucosidase